MRSAAEALAKAVKLGEDGGPNRNPRAFVSPSGALIVYDPVSRVGRSSALETAMGTRSRTAAPTAALALGLLLAPPIFRDVRHLAFVPSAMAQPGTLTRKQTDALD